MDRDRLRSWSLRLAGLLAVLAAGALLVLPALERKRLDRGVSAMLLEVQRGLQHFHVAEEIYPRRPMEGRELVAMLAEAGHLEEGVLNPWTGRPYLEGDGGGSRGEGEDWLEYRTNEFADSYELTALRRGGEEVHFRLDSTEHHSLEE